MIIPNEEIIDENAMEEELTFEDNEHKKNRRRNKEEGSSSSKRMMNKLGPGRPKKQNNALLEPASSIYEIVKQGRSSFQAVVDEWIESYKKDKIKAVLNLMQFFSDSSGCKGKITADMQASLEHSEIIRRLTEQFDEESGDYPIISGGIYKRFRTNFCDFISILIRQCQYSIIFDPYVIDNILHFLIGLADSQVRAFRHTSTLAAVKIMSALVEVILNINVNLEYTIRQFETEKQKCQGKRPTERFEMLTQKKSEIEENMNDVCTQLTYIFRSIFVHRYRDTIPDVRGMCMQEIGVWMKKFPKMFLDDSYLKYIGWTLYDKVGDVRLKCLLSLQPLYSTEELTIRLELFTNKFKDRIIAMTLDKEYEVAVQAVKLVNSILKYHREILTDRDCEHVYELVYSIHRQVAQAAGEFLKERLFTLDEEALGRTVKTKRGKKRLPNTPLIRDLVQFFIESELHEHGAYLVDSLIETNEMMKDWECMSDLLLEEPGRGEEGLDNQQETSLIEIMTCCVKQAATGEPPVGRAPPKKGHTSMKENKILQEERSKLSQHFIVTLPSLIAKYIADPEKIANLMLIPQFFDLDLYTSNRCEKYLDSLLKYSEEIMMKHLNADVLSTCAKTYEYLCSYDHTMKGRCLVSRSTLVDNLVERFKTTYDEFVQEKEEPDEDQIFALVASAKRLSAFSEFHDTTAGAASATDLWECFMTLLKQGCDTGRLYPIPHDILDKVATAAHYHLLWYLNNVTQAVTSLKTAAAAAAASAVTPSSVLSSLIIDGSAVTTPALSSIDQPTTTATILGNNNNNMATTDTTVPPPPPPPLLTSNNVTAVTAAAMTPELVVITPPSLIDQMNALKGKVADYVAVAQELMYAGSYLEEDLYLSICDLLLAFNRHISFTNPPLKHVIYEPDKNLITQLNSFVIEKVFVITPPENEEDTTANNTSPSTAGQNKIEQLRKGRNFLASFCKLIIYNVISIQNSVDIFRNYTKFYTDYGDIIKMTIGKAREISKVSCAKVMITALQYHFRDLMKAAQSEISEPSLTSATSPITAYLKTTIWHEGFTALKELGRRFCLSFGLDQIKNREAIALIHKEGIIFSLSNVSSTSGWGNDNTFQGQELPPPPANIHFLDVVGEFSNKLMKQDKRTVLMFLDRHLPAGILSFQQKNSNTYTNNFTVTVEEWQPLFNYRNSLLQAMDITMTGDNNPNPTASSSLIKSNKNTASTGGVSKIPTSPAPAASHITSAVVGIKGVGISGRASPLSSVNGAAPLILPPHIPHGGNGGGGVLRSTAQQPLPPVIIYPPPIPETSPRRHVVNVISAPPTAVTKPDDYTTNPSASSSYDMLNKNPLPPSMYMETSSIHHHTSSMIRQDLQPIYETVDEEMAELGEKDLNMYLSANGISMEEAQTLMNNLNGSRLPGGMVGGMNIPNQLLQPGTQQQIHAAMYQQQQQQGTNSDINNLNSFVMNPSNLPNPNNNISRYMM